ncbi:MAG: hypothetical protein V4665_00865 [Patescibacteria group bacterium]
MFDFHIINVADASVVTFMQSINRVIINPIIFFLFGCAMAYFLYGVAQYLLSPNNEEVRKKSKSVMIWGIVGLFIMVAVFGIMRLILGTVGEDKIKIQDSGDYEVNNTAVNTQNPNQAANNQQGNLGDSGEVNTNSLDIGSMVDLGSPDQAFDPSTVAANGNYTQSPFIKYIDNPSVCWHKDVYVRDVSEYKALNSIASIARARLLQDTGLRDDQIDKEYPVPYATRTLYDKDAKYYYVWWDARAPIGSGTREDCTLLPAPTFRSSKPSALIGRYVTTASAYRAVDSGVAKKLVDARAIALKNALIEIARQKGLNDFANIGNVTYLEETYFPPTTPAGNYDYWIAIEAR